MRWWRVERTQAQLFVCSNDSIRDSLMARFGPSELRWFEGQNPRPGVQGTCCFGQRSNRFA